MRPWSGRAPVCPLQPAVFLGACKLFVARQLERARKLSCAPDKGEQKESIQLNQEAEVEEGEANVRVSTQAAGPEASREQAAGFEDKVQGGQ